MGKRTGGGVRNAGFRGEYLSQRLMSLKTNTLMKEYANIQLITAAILAIGGMVLLYCGAYIDPQGEIHESLLVAFGEVMTFAGSLFGIDYYYKQKGS